MILAGIVVFVACFCGRSLNSQTKNGPLLGALF